MKILIVVGLVVLGILLLLLVNLFIMWAGNNFLLDIGLETASYWHYFWIVLAVSIAIGSSGKK